jgi:Asp-tRNA(Asn)/Glu-tRNA(Gln) amidotransferase A subunit family amidase
MADGRVTAVNLVDSYLARIEAYDQQGPTLNAMIVLNPLARQEAMALDKERAAGQIRGPLHGVPVVVKDNYDTSDLPTTAGAIALATSIPPDDATQVERLRNAGAVILGKTNMHELARGITTVASYGGQTRNPYNPRRNPGGSSGGTGAAVAASFAAFGMGSDTCGSIRIPSAHHSLVGLRGTRGLASGDGIIPLSTTQDIGGPLARSVEDLALALDATVGYDPADETTRLSEGHIPDTYTAALNAGGLAQARIGVVRSMVGNQGPERDVSAVIEAAIAEMEALGATVIDIEEPDLTEVVQGASVIGQEFKFDFDEYLRNTPDAPVRTLAEVVRQGLYHGILESGLEDAVSIETLDTDDYRQRLSKRDEIRRTIVDLMTEDSLDALLYPTIRQTARPVGQPQPGSNCALSANSGLPAITVPAGYAEDDMPVGVELLGLPWSELRLLELAYAYEQGTEHRRAPAFTPSLFSESTGVVLETRFTMESQLTAEASFTLERSTRVLQFQTAVFGLSDSDVIAIDLHRRSADSEKGPVLRQLSRRNGPRVAGRFRLSGREMSALRRGLLYLDVHTIDNVTGAARIDLSLPATDER